MFYPEDALKKGGRFYFLWVADSWPDRFRAISYRKLCSQDIRDLCDELQEVIISESGRPSHRYSLRLSSQLLRGLVRYYQRKVSVYLNELCMLHATISKNTSKKFRPKDATEQPRQPQAPEQRTAAILPPEEPENEPRVEEILQRSNNVVANIEQITLREAVINEPVLPPNEGFGEENAEQALRFLSERRSDDRAMVGPDVAQPTIELPTLDTTVEHMMVAPDVAQQSALDLPALDTTVQSRDRSRLAPHDAHTNMERISEHDLTALRPSDGGLLSTTGIGKEISNIPDTSIVPIPEPAPEEKQPEERVVEQEIPTEQPRQEAPRRRQTDENLEPTQIELEELEEMGPRAKRRRRLIIDKRIKISYDVMKPRIRNPRVELRCEEVSDDISSYIIIPSELLMSRPCHAGYKERSNMAPALVRLFMSNLGVVHRDTRRASSTEEEEMRAQRNHTRSRLETVPETEEPPVPAPQIQQIEPPQEMSVIEENLAPSEMDSSKGPNVTEINQNDIADMPTQILRTPSKSQEAKKRPSGALTGKAPSPKKPKPTPRTPASGSQRVLQELVTNRGGYVSLREHQRLRQTSARVSHESEKLPEIDTELEKENIGMNQQMPAIPTLQISAMLHEAGISDRVQEHYEPETVTSRRHHEAATSDRRQDLAIIEPTVPETSVNITFRRQGPSNRPQDLDIETTAPEPQPTTSRRQGSDSSPLSGSPDRTKVSLGDSDATTESRRFIKDNWGVEGTMKMIVKCIHDRRAGEQITIRNLVEKGPIIAEYKNIILAKCFTSVLKLRQHGLITIKKCPTTLEILDITVGPKLQHFTASSN